MKTNKQFLSHFLLLATATFLGKGVGFFKEMLVAYYFGTSKELDILIFSFALAGTIFAILSGGMEGTILPNYLRTKKQGEREKNTYTFVVFSAFIVLSYLLFLWVPVLGKDIIGFIARGFSSQETVLAKNYLDLFVVYIILAFFSVFFLSLLKAEKKFFFSGIVPSLIPASIMLALYFQHNIGVITIAFGVLLGVTLQLIFVWIKASKYFNFKKIQPSQFKAHYKHFVKNYSILLGSGLFIGLIDLTDQSFSTLTGAGGVSSLSYAQKLPALLDGVVVLILGTILFSSFSENISASKHRENKALYLKSLKLVFITTIVTAAVLAFFSEELVNLVFVRGKFDHDSLMLVYPVQVAFFLKLPFISVAVISARMMNSFELNKEMLYINICSFILNGILDYYLVEKYGVLGIAYATLFVYMSSASLNYLVVMKRFRKVIQ